MSAIPVARPQIVTRPNLRVVRGTRTNSATSVMQGVLAFAVLTSLIFASSSLAGHVMVEKVRRDGIRANLRLQSAVSAKSVLVRQIEALKDTGALERWAIQSGMIAPEVQTQPSVKSSVVASR